MRTPHFLPGFACDRHRAPWRLLSACLAGVLSAPLSSGAPAQSLQDLAAIQQAALTALQAGPGTQAMLAPGLRLAACRQPLVAVPSTPTVADVRCPDAPGWRLFVPVRNAPMALAASPAAGAPADGGAPAVIVKRGDPVVLRARIGNSEIRMGGRALGQAMAGNVVNVENDSSHRIIRGRLNADGTVDVVN
ncbi:flagella basal body P-ring formation protein FlgA [Thermomonas sp. S9]|uniref:flagella basal body P-ring formation protein FlgA n=1 Tax=Thermomonas sp. S9 TaxID=2885203 RepID=UPI00216AFC8A|nr:flagella basal body P-ring formation protein FlgA [Thermomonas sp. S9]MCR6496355.1 flagella basal body P-ring formation protein FlgA [Thermomonas sp. S9]